MLKNILNLDGAQQLSKMDQKEINGGKMIYRGTCETPVGGTTIVCPAGTSCVDTLYGPQCLPGLGE